MNTGADHTADFKALAILTKALITGILLFCVISILLHYFGGLSETFRDESKMVFTIILVLTVIVLITTRLIYSKRINILKETNQSSKEKLDIFRSITITHMALCEFTALLSVICFIILGDYLFFIPVGIAIIEMILKFPTQSRIESTINSGTF